MKKNAIVGATGMIGKPVTQAFVDAGYEVSAFVRNIERARKVLPEAVQLVQGDLENLLKLEIFLKDADYLYLNLSPDKKAGPKKWQPEREGLANVLAIAKKMGVKRVGFISSIVQRYQGVNNFDWWIFEIKNLAVDKIKESGLPYVIFYPSNVMETLPATIQGNKLLYAGKPQYKNWWIAGYDYGKQIAKAFEVIPTDENREYVIQGPEALTFHEASDIFLQYYSNQKLTPMKVPLWLIKFFGIFSKEANYAGHIIEALDKYPEKFEAQRAWDELGKPETTVAQFAKSL
ncbi:MAG: NAD(P)H-binding protein [Saprospiraceae bacterium]|nr:NAD(P)H-binding protein [Saprospiraceae bacterium]